MTGKFIVFEGGEGSGKTTQAKLLYEALKKEGKDILLTKEPGGDEGICRDIRLLLLKPDYKDQMSPHAELLLFEADRAQHVDKVIRPALEAGKIVISDRFDASTFAYQFGGRELYNSEYMLRLFDAVNLFATNGLKPDFTFWIDIDPKIGLRRNTDIGKRDRFEMEDVAFHERVRKGFSHYFRTLNFVDQNKGARLDGSLSIEELHNQVLETIKTKQLV